MLLVRYLLIMKSIANILFCFCYMFVTEAAEKDSCSFDRTLCNWTQDTTDEFDWVRQAGYTTSGHNYEYRRRYYSENEKTGPTSGYGGGGYYTYAEADGQVQGATARLISKTLPKGNVTVAFYDCLYGTTMGTLRVFTKIGDLLQKQGSIISGVTYSRAWRKNIIKFQCLSNCQVVLQATRGYGISSDIAIDEITIELEPQPTEPSNVVEHPHGHGIEKTSSSEERRYCNFDDDQCNSTWTQDTSDDFDWLLQSGKSVTPNTGPATGYTGVGSYMLLEARNHNSGQKARLISNAINPGYVTLSFWYSMNGYDIGSLAIYKRSVGVSELLWMKVGDQKNKDWKIAMLNTTCTRSCQIIIEGEVGVFEHGDIGIDEINLVIRHNMPLDLSQNAVLTNFCDFETNWCDWSQLKTNKVLWERWNGSTPKSNTGPTGDYTSGNGSYALFQDSTARANSSAVLSSYVIRCPLWRKLHFAYHMLHYNGQTSALNIYKTSESTRNRQLIWNERTNEGVWEWQIESINITSDEPYVIEIEAVGGTRGYGDIAIDNIEISSGVLAGVVNCDFYSSFCNWTQRNDDDFDWMLNGGETPSELTGPTEKSGYYAYIETSFPRLYGHVAVIDSPSIGPFGNQSVCIRFLYNMYGSQVGKLELQQKDCHGNAKKVLWNRSGNQGLKWWPAYVTVPFTDNDIFQFSFRGERKYGIRGDIAIKGVLLDMKSCHEDAPYDCDFETDLCEWNHSSGDHGNWSFSLESKSNDTDLVPPSDHTTGSRDGGYIYVSSSSTKARIHTTVNTNRVLCVQFWYFSYGSDRTGKLDFWTQPSDGSIATIYWTFNKETVTWQRAKITVQSNLQYVMGFQASASDGFKAIDDIIVTHGTCA